MKCLTLFTNSQNSKPVKVKGRLRSHIQFWQFIQAPQFIIDTILRGYIILFLTTPPIYGAHFRNNKSAFAHSNFVESAITELISSGSVLECLSASLTVNPLSVSIQSSGKKRPILDLRYPNSFLILSCLMDCPQNWIFSFDIKSGYHHINISPDDFLGFSLVFNGVLKYFKFTVLPFVLATGPYIFTKVMRPLVKHWRSKAYKIVVYLDDGMGVCPSFTLSIQQACGVKPNLVNNSGFVPNDEKRFWFPTQCVKWLGFDWDLNVKTLSVRQPKIPRLLAAINEALALKKLSARQLASVTGLIISNMLLFSTTIEQLFLKCKSYKFQLLI